MEGNRKVRINQDVRNTTVIMKRAPPAGTGSIKTDRD